MTPLKLKSIQVEFSTFCTVVIFMRFRTYHRFIDRCKLNVTALLLIVFVLSMFKCTPTVTPLTCFDVRPTIWPLSTHLEDVTSQVISFVSIYKTIKSESERERHRRDSCSSTASVCLYLSMYKEREEREGATECDKFPQSLACHLAAGKV